jgi:ATP-binding cassette subfamily B protein RaxB
MGFFRKLAGSRPAIEPQTETADCGYVCISAVLALLGKPRSVDDIKRVAGTTSRGLTIKQVRDGLARFDVKADAVFFNKHDIAAYPDRGILLLDRGHFVVVARKRGQSLEIYDPIIGWSWITVKRLKRTLSGFAILVRDAADKSARALRPRSFHRHLVKSTLEPRFLRKAVGLFACAQIFALVLPLISMRSVDASISQETLGFAGIVLVGFLALSFVNALSSTVGEFVQAKLKAKMYRRLGGLTFDSVLAKDPAWFENVSGATIHNQINSLQIQMDFVVDGLRVCATLAITIVAGVAALLFISPWLAVPGLVSLVLTSAVDIFLTRRQRGLMSSSVEASQRRHAFVLGTLVQMPLMVRHGSVRQCRAAYVRLMARVGSAASAMQVLQGWRTTLTMLLKSSETIVFVTLAAWFMSVGEYTIGGFVAVGAYKDLLAGALAQAFQLGVRHNTLAIHRIQAGRLLESGLGDSAGRTGIDVEEGSLSVRDLSYRYGTLDNLALRNVSFVLPAGECLVIKGVSGSGKTTLAKLLIGVVSPSEGQIRIDGKALAYPVRGIAAVLQTDRLISGSIRENIALYRPHVSDSEIWKALEICFADEFVRDFPMRLNSIVAEGMTGLSGGQRQRLLLARATVGRPKILILDEATASLDVETESAIMQNLRQLGMTLIVISHRPEIWKHGDKLIEIAAGEIVESKDTCGGRFNIA